MLTSNVVFLLFVKANARPLVRGRKNRPYNNYLNKKQFLSPLFHQNFSLETLLSFEKLNVYIFTKTGIFRHLFSETSGGKIVKQVWQENSISWRCHFCYSSLLTNKMNNRQFVGVTAVIQSIEWSSMIYIVKQHLLLSSL